MTIADIPEVDRALKKEFKAHSAPIIELIESQTKDPFCVLVGTILSARTKDACTAGAVRRLFAKAKGACFAPEDLERLSVKEIEKLIFPVGFYHDKARHLKALPKEGEIQRRSAEYGRGAVRAAGRRAQDREPHRRSRL